MGSRDLISEADGLCVLSVTSGGRQGMCWLYPSNSSLGDVVVELRIKGIIRFISGTNGRGIFGIGGSSPSCALGRSTSRPAAFNRRKLGADDLDMEEEDLRLRYPLGGEEENEARRGIGSGVHMILVGGAVPRVSIASRMSYIMQVIYHKAASDSNTAGVFLCYGTREAKCSWG